MISSLSYKLPTFTTQAMVHAFEIHRPSLPPSLLNHPLWTIHSVLNLHNWRYVRCSVRYCPRKLLWYVPPPYNYWLAERYFRQILWYNKSRKTGRVCPSCRRLYRLGDVLPDHMKEEEECKAEPRSKELIREQEISGLCTPYPHPKPHPWHPLFQAHQSVSS